MKGKRRLDVTPYIQLCLLDVTFSTQLFIIN